MTQDPGLGLAYLTVAGAAPLEHIEAAAAAGYGNVGLRLVAPLGLTLPHEIVGNAPLVRSIRTACRNTGVRVYDVDALTLAAGTDMAQLGAAVDVAGELGAEIVQLVVEDPERQRAIDRFAVLCAAAAPLNITVTLEFMRWRAVKTIEDACAFVTAAGRPNGGVCLDVLHLSRSFGSPAAVAAVPAGLLTYVQICDAPARIPPLDEQLLAEARGRRLYPGEGQLWLDELFDALPTRIPISVEAPRDSDAHLGAHERARLAAAATNDYLAGYRARRAARQPHR